MPRSLPRFYRVPDPLRPGRPGDVVRVRRLATTGIHGTVYRVMYHSRSVRGRDVVVTGLIAVPRSRPPAGGYAVISWGHGTDGIAALCAPSLLAENFGDLGTAEVNALLDRGYLVTASDYEGLGTTGHAPYLVGVSEARGTIDIVRAARRLSWLHASDRYLVWGHSEGGQAALFALHIADRWAPEVRLVGAVAGAPPSQLARLLPLVAQTPFMYHILDVLVGFNAAYGNQAAPLAPLLTPAGVHALGLESNTCQNDPQGQFANLVTTNPLTNPKWEALINANDAGRFTRPSPEPLLIIQGSDDAEIPAFSTRLLFSQLCRIGQTEQRWTYTGQTHAGVIAASTDDMLRWIASRFAARPAPGQAPHAATISTMACGQLHGRSR